MLPSICALWPSNAISSTTQRNCKTRSDFVLEAACDKARAVLLDQVFFSLDADKFRQFTQLLDASPTPNPGLAHLMAIQAPWTTTQG